MTTTYEHQGRLLGESTTLGVAGYRVEAWDASGIYPFPVGYALSDSEGGFRMALTAEDVEAIFEGREAKAFFLVFTGAGAFVQSTEGAQTWDLGVERTASRITVLASPPTSGPSPSQLVVRGRVVDADLGPLDAVTVAALDVRFGTETPLGSVTSNANGEFHITYSAISAASAGKVLADILVRVTQGGETLAETPIRYQAPASLELTVVVGGVAYRRSELSYVDDEVTSRLGGPGGTDIKTVDDEVVGQLARSVGRDTDTVRALRTAATLADGFTHLGRDALYGMQRQGLPEDPNELLRVPASAHRAVLEAARAARQVQGFTDYDLDDAVYGVVEEQVNLAVDNPPAGMMSLADVFGHWGVSASATRGFVRRLARHEGSIDDLFPGLEAPFAPTDLSDCFVWLRADKEVATDALGNLGEWGNLGSGPSPATGKNDPGIEPSIGSLDIPAINTATSAYVALGTNEVSHDYTLVMRVVKGGANTRTLLSAMQGAAGHVAWALADNDRITLDEGSGAVELASAAVPDGDRVLTLTLDATAGVASAYVDGRRIGTGEYSGTATIDALTLGVRDTGSAQTDFLDGLIHEVILYSRVLTTTELAQLHAYAIRNDFREPSASDAQTMRFALQVAAVTRYHDPLIGAIRASSATSLRDLALLTESDWASLIAGTGAPVDVPGANQAEREANYAKILVATMRFARPTAALQAELDALGSGASVADKDVRAFLADNPTVELGEVRPAYAVATGVTSGVSDVGVTRTRLESWGRVLALTPHHDKASGMLDKGYDSSFAIASVSENRFVEDMSGVLAAKDARDMHQQAVARKNGATGLWAAFSAATNGPKMAALPDWQTPSLSPAPEVEGWESIFGKLNLCACEHCQSAYSPAAYLIDLLRFLNRYSSEVARPTDGGTWSGRDLLLGASTTNDSVDGRRPDIAKLAISCENTNTALPYIDLVNEIMEWHVAGQVPSSLPSLIDTTAPSNALLSAPEVIDPAVHQTAYAALANAFYPWSLPYALWQHQIRVYLDHLGVPRDELMRTFQRRFSPGDIPGVLVWLRADSGVTIEGGRVTQWADLSGFGHSAQAIDGVSSPTYAAEGGSNDQAYLQFSGAEGLAIADTVALRETERVTVIAIAGSLAASGDMMFVLKGSLHSAFNYGVSRRGGMLTAEYHNGPRSGPTLGADGDTAVVSIVVQHADSTSHRRNGVDVAALGNPVNGLATAPLTLGARHSALGGYDLHLDGRLYEVLVVRGALTTADRDALEAYAIERYGADFTPAVTNDVAPTALQISQEALRLSADERDHIVTASPTAPDHPEPEEHWGFAQGSPTWTTDLKVLSTFMQASSLAYDEVRELLDTKLLLGFAETGKVPALVAASGTAGCHIDDLRIANLESSTIEDAWTTTMRFLRLRRRLGWASRHLDKLLTALGPALDDAFLTSLGALIAMRREPRLRRLGLDELAAWWGPLDTQATPSLREASLYDRLFQNPAVQNPAPLSFALGNLAGRIDGSLAQVLPGLSLTTTQLANLAGADKAVSRVGHVLGSLGLTAQELALLTSGEDAQSLVGLLPAADRSLSHENLSRLFRLRSLARGARLKLPELLVLQALADLAPLLGDDAAAPADPEQTRLFLEEQERVRRSGLDLPTIDYLVRHHVQPGTGVVGEARAVDERLAAVTAAVKPVVEETAYPEHNPGARLREVLAELLSTSTDGAEPVAAGAARQVEAVMAIVEGTSEDDAATQAATLESVLAPFVADIESLKTTLVFSPTVDLATQCVLWLEPDLTAEGQSDRFGAWTNHATTGSATVRLPKPTDLSGCLLWLRADLGVTVDGEGLVTGWADQSGQGNHAAQTTPANSPRLLTGGGVAGTAGIDFDGSDDFLSLASLGHTDGDYTVIVVFEQRSTDAEQVLLAGTTGDHVFYAATNTTAKVGVDDGTTTREIDDATVGPQMLTFVLSSGGTSIELHRNGSSAGTATYDGTGGLTAGNVVLGGSSAPLDGVVSEVIVYDHALSATELRIAHGMLGARYGLGASSGSRVLQDGQGPFGLPALQLNGQDDHLLIENIGSGATNYTVVAVHRHDALVDGQGVAILDDGDQSLIFAAQRTGTLTGNPPVVGAHVGGTWFSSGNARAGDQIATWVVDDGDDLASFYRDGEPIGSVAMASATTLTTPAGLGGHAGTTAKTFNGSIACLGIIGGALDATQLSQLHHYLYKLTGHDKRYTLVLQALLDHLRTRDAKTAIADTLGASLQIPAIRAQALLGSWLSSFSTPSSPLVTDFLPATSTTSAATDDQQRHAVIRFSKAATLVRELALTGDDLEGAFGGRKNPAFLDLDALPVEASSYRRFDAMQTAMVDGALMLPSWLTVRCPTANRSAQTGTSTVNVRLKADAARAHSLDGEAWGLLLEPARSNLVSNQDLTTWSPLGSITVSAEIAPDGAVQSMRLQNVNGGATDQLRLVPLPQTPSLAMHTASMWHRVIGTQPTNGSRMQFGGMTPTLSVNSGVVAPEQYWAHRNASAVFTGGSSPTANLIPRDGTNDVGAADYWGMQLEAGAYPTSFIGADNATFTRAADTLVANLADAGIASDGYFDVSLTYAPLYSDAEAAANHDLVYIDDANRIYFDIATKTFIAKIGGVTTASAAVTFSRHQALTITVSHQASGVSLTVAGATTGNGTTTGAAQPALHPVPAQAYILGNATGAQEGASLRRLDWGTSDLPAARKRYRALMAVLDVLALRDTFRARDGSLFNLLAAAASQPSLEQAAGALAAQARWSADDVQICAEALGLRTASLLAQADHLVRLVEAVRAVQRTGSNRAPGWIHVDEEPAAGFAVADEVLTTARAKHSDDGWVEVGRRLRDELRDAQRDALLAYLLQNPPASYGTGPVPNADALYEHLLVDVEMSPCALTSRIKLAISSAQLLIQRALMGVEPTLRLDTIAAREYEWMRNYRVWEANRKVFFYPENWLEPSWRDDKTPQFEALESFLRQGALTDERVEDAYLRYLDDLSELARLEIVGMVHHLVPASTQERVIDEHHVIGRTRGVPRRYFHRIRKNQSYWTPWRELDIEIEDDHILPVIHEGRLFLVGAKFEEVIYEQLEKSVIMQHKITMWSSAWKNGQWSPPILADGEVLSPPLNQEPEPHPTEFHTLVATADSICVVLDKTPSTDGQAWVITGSTDLEIVVRATFDDCRGRLRLESDTGTLQLPVPGSCNLQFTGFRYHRTGSFFAGLKIWFPTSEGVKNVYVIKGEPGFWIQDEHRSGGDVLLPFTSFVYQNGTRSLFAASVTARRLPGYDPVGAIDPDASKSSWPKGQFPQAKTSEEQPISEGWQSQTVVQMPYVNHEDMLRFHAFDHPYFCEVARRVRVMGVAAARQWDSPTALQSLEDVYFESEFTPNDAIVRRPYPRDEFDFSHSGAYSAYNWELFFHVPYLLAKRLLADGRHDEARKWLHAIFDPTEASESGDARRFWKLKPFKEIDDLASVQASLGDDPSGTTAMTKTIKPVFVYVDDAEAEKADLFDIVEQIQAWHEAPFRPFVVARMRPLAFMKATVRLYIENLIAWGDQLFGRDTIESINEATQLYLLAKALLGDKPVHVESPSVASVSVENVGTISSTHPMVQAETLLFQTTSSSDWGGIQASMPEFPAAFCVPQNDALLGLWGTVDDRLFKIRHCLNIEGVARPLPLYEPPIDPALLVDAIAAGLDIGSVLDDLATPRPHYRFEAIVGRALEQVQTVSALGGGLLSAIEKADGERLAVLRQQHEIAIQTMIRETRRDQLNEAKETLAGVEQSRRLAEARFAFYASREKVSLGEQAALDQGSKAADKEASAADYSAAAVAASQAPDLAAGPGAGTGPANWAVFGGSLASAGLDFKANRDRRSAGRSRDQASQAGTLAGYERRWDDWKHQQDLAERELKQIDKQILAAKIRVDIATKELATVDKQREQAKEVEAFLKGKFSNQALYDWHIEQLSELHFQAYKLAYGLCRSAEKAYRYERGEPDARFVQFGHWDGRRKGLLAGDKLLVDLRRMQKAFVDKNRREHELSRSVSLAEHFPEALLALRETGSAVVQLDESFFDRDYPGHYMRRLKSVSLTLPAVTGPYSSVNCTLTLLNNRVRHTAVVGDDYLEEELNDSRFTYHYGAITSVCTSSGQNDSGMFELNFRDERYLPFEGAGSISTWRIDMPHDTNWFDVRSLSDVIVQLSFMARPGGDVLGAAAREAAFPTGEPRTARRLVSARGDLSLAMAAFENSLDPSDGTQTLSFDLGDYVPFIPGVGAAEVTSLSLAALWNVDGAVSLPASVTAPSGGTPEAIELTATPFTLAATGESPDGWTLTVAQSDILALGADYIEDWPDTPQGTTPFKRIKPAALHDLVMIVGLSRETVR